MKTCNQLRPLKLREMFSAEITNIFNGFCRARYLRYSTIDQPNSNSVKQSCASIAYGKCLNSNTSIPLKNKIFKYNPGCQELQKPEAGRSAP